MSKNLVIFLLLVGGVVYIAQKEMKKRLKPAQTTQKQVEKKENEVQTSSEDKVVQETKVTKSFEPGLYVCPQQISITPYGLDSTPRNDSVFYKPQNPMKLKSSNIGRDGVTCKYDSGFGGVYYLYQMIEETQCRKITNGFGFQCTDSNKDMKTYNCWEMRTSSSEKPFLRFKVSTPGGENIAESRGWEYIVPKGYLSSVSVNRRREMECAYSIEISGEYILKNQVTRYKQCENEGEGVRCH